MNNKIIGNQGELLAKERYESLGYEILESNYRHQRGEIDFIAMQNEDTLIFVEVKSRNRNDYGEPETFVSNRQQALIKEAAENYIYEINWKKEIRFDIVCINANNQLEVFEDAF